VLQNADAADTHAVDRVLGRFQMREGRLSQNLATPRSIICCPSRKNEIARTGGV
jgi:hypothetical protein